MLLWVWQKWATYHPATVIPADVMKVLEPRRGKRLLPCTACAEGTCNAMAEAAAASSSRAGAEAPLGGAQPSRGPAPLCRVPLLPELRPAEPAAQIVYMPRNGDCVFAALGRAKRQVDGKPWPDDDLAKARIGRYTRSWWLKAAKQFFETSGVVRGEKVRQHLLEDGESPESYLKRMEKGSGDAHSWAGVSEITIFGLYWDIDFTIFQLSEDERWAELRGLNLASEARPGCLRAALLDAGGHYESLNLTPAAWAAVDAALRRADLAEPSAVRP